MEEKGREKKRERERERERERDEEGKRKRERKKERFEKGREKKGSNRQINGKRRKTFEQSHFKRKNINLCQEVQKFIEEIGRAHV